jgi:hypothetical protein
VGCWVRKAALERVRFVVWLCRGGVHNGADVLTDGAAKGTGVSVPSGAQEIGAYGRSKMQ